MNDKVVAIGHNFMLNPNLKNEIFRLKNNDLVLGRDLGSLESNFRRILVWDSLNLENQFYLEEGMKEERLFNGGKLINIRSQTGIVEKFIQAYLNFPRINESSMGVYTGPNHVAYSYVKHEENSVLIYSGYLNDNKKVKLHLAKRFVAIFAFTFSLSMGALWEIIEFVIDQVFDLNMQKSGIVDTMTDLIVDTIGALIISISSYYYILKVKVPVFYHFISNLVEKNPHIFRRKKNKDVKNEN